MDNQKPSSSRSSHQKTTKQEMVKVGDGQAKKKLKEESNHGTTKQVEIEDENPSPSFDDLPPEMLIEILKYLDTKTLFRCRRLNRSWNGIANEILQSRNDLELKFLYDKTYNEKAKFVRMVFKNWRIRKNLEEFNENFSSSKNFRYSHVQFYGLDGTALANRNWTRFLSICGENIKCLKLNMRNSWGDSLLKKFMERVRVLLLNQLPNLQEFGLDLSLYQGLSHILSETQLFPKTTTPTTTAQLPHLKILHLENKLCSTFVRIATDLLEAAVNLETIFLFYGSQSYSSDGGDVKSFPLLQSLGKLRCVQAAQINFSYGILSKFTETSAASLPLKLKTLDLNVSSIYRERSSWPLASIFLSNVFESSKDTLTDIKMTPLGFLEEFLQIPKFIKLTTLSIKKIYNQKEISTPIFPPETDLNNIFPALRSLELDIPWTIAFPQHSIGSIPTLKFLQVPRVGMHADVIAQIGIMFPNLTDFKCYRDNCGPLMNFPTLGTAIWTHLKKLQTLDMKINLTSPANAFPAMDSCITGFSGEDSAGLYDVIEANKLKGNEVHVPQSELMPERKNPSILDLKELKNLTLHLCRDAKEKTEGKESDLKKAITGVSEEYAFKLMDNFKYSIKY